MSRSRFRNDEQFTQGQTVEVRNGSHWHAATVTGPRAKDELDLAYYPTQITASRGSLRAGDYFRGYPTSIRAPKEDS